MQVNEITRALIGYLDQYRKLPEIIRMLHFCGIDISEREFATYVELYRQQDNEYYLESCSNGYRFTRDKKAIQKSCYQRIRKGVSMILNAKRDLKLCSEKSQLLLSEQFINELKSIENQVSVVQDV